MARTYNFHNTYTTLSPKLFEILSAPIIPHLQIVLLNNSLLKNLDIDFSEKDNPAKLLEPSEEKAFAQSYAGHQFGHFTVLGDGRAMMLGEHLTTKNQRCDIQLKGSGVTKYSRGGDGKATVSSMIREYLYSFALKELGVKSSGSLAVLSTNEKVIREEVHEGAILIRIMEGHIRFGTFEFVSKYCSKEEFTEFANYVINRHFLEIANDEQKYLLLFQKILKNTISMVIDWYRIGFIHGVMNTDNMSITGETFDFGPCSFINAYNPSTTFSEIDSYGRYSFGAQKEFLKWNLTVLANAFVPLLEENTDALQKEIDGYDAYFEEQFLSMMSAKLGVSRSEDLVKEFLEFMETSQPDYTNTFIELMCPGTFSELQTPEFEKIRKELEEAGMDREVMMKNNPQRILRNYLVEDAIGYYVETGSLEKVHTLLKAVSSPYAKDDDFKDFQKSPSADFDKQYHTHCNT